MKELWKIQDEKQKGGGACVMDVHEFVDGGSLEETMQN